MRRRACSAAAKLKNIEIVKDIAPCLDAKEPQVRQYALKAVLKSKCHYLHNYVLRVLEKEDKQYNIDLCMEILDKTSLHVKNSCDSGTSLSL